MRFALGLLVLATSACAQPATDKPAALEVDSDRQRRADSAITRPDRVDLEADSGSARATETDTVVVAVGDLEVAVVTHTIVGPSGTSSAFWAVNLHDDEGTSVEAALEVAAETGGVVVELQHTGERNAAFQVGNGGSCGADPNRIFTAAGLERTLASRSESPVPAACADAIRPLAEHVLTQTGLEGADVVVTLHNNTEDRYSAASYAPGAEYATDAADVTIRDGSDTDDFFFVTDKDLYDALAARGFNAVLQDNDAATDDGSLSVWAAQNGRPYVNVEAQHGHVAEQTRMIRALVEVLSERR